MNQATIPLPVEISANCPRQYVAYLNDPAIADIAPSKSGRNIVVACDEKTLSWATDDWVLRVSTSALSGGLIGKSSYGDYEFITFVLAFGGKERGGPAMLKGELGSAAWFKGLADSLASVIPGGVQWRIT